MGHRVLLLLFVSLCYYVAAVQTGSRVKSPATRFTCQGRASGYYADVETGCQVYHMCDGLGRQFSYSCPNTTLFQQRMLICDHWYMVNCSNSESDYDANLLIGQRDKPFVSESDMRLRTPRPDILSVPPNSKYYDGLREAESKFPSHPGNSIVGISDTFNTKENELDSDKRNYRPPSSWSTGSKKKLPSINKSEIDIDSNTPEINKGKTNVLKTNNVFSSNSNVNRPSQLLEPPFLPSTTESDFSGFDLNGKVKPTSDPVFNFIKRFDPNSSDSIKTAMTKTEIIDLNHHLPEGQISSEEERSPRKNKNFANNLNIVQTNSKNSASEASRFNTVNIKPKIDSNTQSSNNQVVPPSKELIPPKFDITPKITTTMGPPIYYEWKWAVPAFDLEPPKLSNETNSTTPRPVKPAQKRPFSVITRSTPKEVEQKVQTLNTEYNISSYFVPDYVFPLDAPHPGYEDENAQTSFQVNIPRPGRESYGENPACPQCHPAYLNPGTCEPCIVKR